MGLEQISGYEMTALGDALYDRATGQVIPLKDLDSGRLAHLVHEVSEQRRELSDAHRVLRDELNRRVEQLEMRSVRFGSFIVERRTSEEPYVRVRRAEGEAA